VVAAITPTVRLRAKLATNLDIRHILFVDTMDETPAGPGLAQAGGGCWLAAGPRRQAADDVPVYN
jgi:hypothetical protein